MSAGDTQSAVILSALKAGRTVTPIEALQEFGCFRLAARICDLRQAGHPIERSWGTDGEKRWAEYRMRRGAIADALNAAGARR